MFLLSIDWVMGGTTSVMTKPNWCCKQLALCFCQSQITPDVVGKWEISGQGLRTASGIPGRLGRLDKAGNFKMAEKKLKAEVYGWGQMLDKMHYQCVCLCLFLYVKDRWTKGKNWGEFQKVPDVWLRGLYRRGTDTNLGREENRNILGLLKA